MDYYMAEVVMFAFDWAPANFASCNGSMLPINQFAALYSLLGTKFGGDGRVTFGLPDLRGRLSVGMGQGSGLTPRNFADKIGAEQVTLNTSTLPAHSHTVQEKTAGQTITVNANSNATPDKNKPQGAYWAKAQSGTTVTPNYSSTHDTTMASDAVQLAVGNLATSSAGDGNPFELYQPSLVLNYCICMEGIYPTRD